MRALAFVVAVAAASAPAVADAEDGFYFAESGGVAMSRDRLGAYVNGVMQLRVSAGVREGAFAIEPWMSAAMATDRVGDLYGVGGQPAPGRADLASYGADAKYIHPIWRRLEVYARGGPFVASGTGALDGYHGLGIGTGAGLQLTGKVRALGFVFFPYFWSKRGPLVTGGVFVDEGVDFYRLSGDDLPGISSHVGHVSGGFAIGQSF